MEQSRIQKCEEPYKQSKDSKCVLKEFRMFFCGSAIGQEPIDGTLLVACSSDNFLP